MGTAVSVVWAVVAVFLSDALGLSYATTVLLFVSVPWVYYLRFWIGVWRDPASLARARIPRISLFRVWGRPEVLDDPAFIKREAGESVLAGLAGMLFLGFTLRWGDRAMLAGFLLVVTYLTWLFAAALWHPGRIDRDPELIGLGLPLRHLHDGFRRFWMVLKLAGILGMLVFFYLAVMR